MQLRQTLIDTSEIGNSTHSAAREPAPFDLDQLRRRCMGQLDLVERLLASFDKRFPLALVEMESCLATGDSSRLAQLTHQLKGAAANIAAPRLQNLLQKIEDAARAGQPEEAAGYVTQLQSEWETFTEYRGSACLS